jgi:hypothetical protein
VARAVLVVLGLGASLAIAACGGGGTETVTRVRTQASAEALTKAEYVAAADAICKNHRARREDLEKQATGVGPIVSKDQAHQVADLLRQASDNLMVEVQELRALQPPTADASTLGSMLSILSAQAAEIDDWADAYDKLDAQEIRRFQTRIAEDTAEATGIAQGYGFKVCGQNRRRVRQGGFHASAAAPSRPRRVATVGVLTSAAAAQSPAWTG